LASFSLLLNRNSGRRLAGRRLAGRRLDNAFATEDFRGLNSAETTLQLSQLIELGGKREARIAAGTAELEAARWERAAVRLDLLSETAIAFFEVLSAQRRIDVYDLQIAALDRLTPLLQRPCVGVEPVSRGFDVQPLVSDAATSIEIRERG
jgi:outer membrane protein TolC